jgi:hypothetical protein
MYDIAPERAKYKCIIKKEEDKKKIISKKYT